MANPNAGKMDYPAHEKGYAGFLKVTRVAMVIVAIVTAVVVYVIAN